MAILQVHQAKALKQVHEGSTDLGLMQELRTASHSASHSAVPWEGDVHHGGPGAPSLAQPGRDEGRRQGTLSRRPGDTVEGFAQQFSAVQQQTEAIQHILPRRDAPSTATPGARPQSARRCGRPPASSRAAPLQAESTPRPARRASHRRVAPPRIPARPQVVQEVDYAAMTRATRRCWSLLFLRRQREQRRSFPRQRAGRRILCSVPPLVQGPAGPCLARGDCCPPGKGCNQAGPSSRDEAGVSQPLLHRTREKWSTTNPGSASLEPGLHNPGSASLEPGLHKLPFKMLMRRRIIKCIHPQDWFAAIVKDAYIHVSIFL